MSRGIDFYVIRKNEPRWITGYVGQAVGSPQCRMDWEGSRGLRVRGVGMDMGFHVVNTLSYVLHGRDDKGDSPSPYEATRASYKAGYSLKHRWI